MPEQTTTVTPEEGRHPAARTDDGRPKFGVRLAQRAQYCAIRVAIFAAGLLPECVTYRVAGWAGHLYFRFAPSRRRYALRMLQNAYPHESDRRKLLGFASKGTGNLLKVILDVALVGKRIHQGRIPESIDMTELAAAGLKPPWIGVTPHLGGWEYGAIGVATMLREAHATARGIKNPLAEEYFRNARLAAGLHIHDRRGGVRGVLRALEQGHVALQVTDQHQRLRGLDAPFFGELASTERAAATLAIRLNVPFLVAAAVRTGAGPRFKFHVEDVLKPEITGDMNADVLNLVTRMNRSFETLIRRFPEQYLWIHNRYRTPASAIAHGV